MSLVLVFISFYNKMVNYSANQKKLFEDASLDSRTRMLIGLLAYPCADVYLCAREVLGVKDEEELRFEDVNPDYRKWDLIIPKKSFPFSHSIDWDPRR